MTMRILTTALLVTATLLYATPANAVLLSDLIDNQGTIQSGDKLFEDFAYTATGQMPSADAVEIIATDVSGNYGISVRGAFLDLPGGSGSDAVLTYKVTATAENWYINDVHIQTNGVIGDEGTFTITDTFLPENDETILLVGDVNSGGSQWTKLTDWADLPEPVKTLHVQKDILAFAQGSAPVTMSFVDQTYSQIPEPASAGLFLVGLVGLMVYRRK